ncbi:Nmad5 family putative nucleotide modification protein [Achromobacter xylosoxidans]|uniref:Nmad5 family putative nucleotide modification protein n=1 Tax=Alcaligenes xylosoxydans xylosoxydans TaxID=85698 RepID=UPI001EEB6D35|nr:Nmad5 family putative nucleotide modification protein [Achromobacter xylosoxidans]
MRLTKEFRDALIGKALKHAFTAREKDHETATTALADALYEYTHGAAEKIAKKLPQGWVSHDLEIRIDAAGFSWNPNHTGLKNYSLKMSKARAFPRYEDKAIKVGGAHPLNELAQAVAAEHAAIRDEKDALRVKLRALVYSVTTLPRLREAWPECEQFLPDAAPKIISTAIVPVELVPQVNKALGIKAKARRPSHA